MDTTEKEKTSFLKRISLLIALLICVVLLVIFVGNKGGVDEQRLGPNAPILLKGGPDVDIHTQERLEGLLREHETDLSVEMLRAQNNQ